MFFKKSSEYGRSMIEMLGVLAIVGILSFGAIAGFQKAMIKHKINKLTEQYTLFIQEYLLKYKKDWLGVCKKNQNKRVVIAPYMTAMGLPAGWKIASAGSQLLLDSLNYSVIPFADPSRVGFDFYIRQSGNSNADYELCRQFFLNVIKPFENDIYLVSLYQPNNSSTSTIWFGIPYCNAERKCLANLKLEDLLPFCQRCSATDNSGRCVIAAQF